MTSATYRLRPIAGLGEAAALWLAINAASDALGAVLSALDIYLISNVDFLSPTMLRLWDWSVYVGYTAIPIYIVCVVVVGKWIYRASANAHAIRPGARTSPPWSLGWFFIPVANLWKPAKAMGETWRATFNPDTFRTASTPDVLRWWWGMWLVGGIAGNISFRMNLRFQDAEMLTVAAGFGVVSCLAGIVAALALRRIVLRVSEAQTQRGRTQVF